MLTSALQTKWIMRLMVLLYLVLSFGTANATFWCHGDDNFIHLESSPIGKCWINCSSDSGDFQQGLEIPQTTGFSSSTKGDCLDSPVFTSVLTTSSPINSLNRILASSFDAASLSHIPELCLENTRLVNRSQPADLPEPQTLKVLRTVVLLR